MENAADFIEGDDFAVDALLDGEPVEVILDSATREINGQLVHRPIVVGSFDELSGAFEGSELLIDDAEYTVAESPHHDGQRVLTTLYLRDA